MCSEMSQWETGLQSAGDVTHRKRAEDFGDLKKLMSWVVNKKPDEKSRLSGLAEARRICAPHEMGVGYKWKSQNRKNVYHSSYVEEPLNSKVIKSFVPELRSRKCFSCFEITMFYVYVLWKFYVCLTHIHVWVCYIYTYILYIFQTIKFRIGTQYIYQKHFYFKLFSLVKLYFLSKQSFSKQFSWA